ncbi:unnamed protein product, partial [Ectocarpus sp. 12 AP-2014]
HRAGSDRSSCCTPGGRASGSGTSRAAGALTRPGRQGRPTCSPQPPASAPLSHGAAQAYSPKEAHDFAAGNGCRSLPPPPSRCAAGSPCADYFLGTNSLNRRLKDVPRCTVMVYKSLQSFRSSQAGTPARNGRASHVYACIRWWCVL